MKNDIAENLATCRIDGRALAPSLAGFAPLQHNRVSISENRATRNRPLDIIDGKIDTR